MTVSKRTRFEVLRRDDHTCQYCGAKAPDVVLHVDHVEPVTLGGSDKPDNLVTACKDCNTGKASIAPGSPLVQAVGAKAAAYALGMIDKMTRLRHSVEQGDEYVVEFEDAWKEFKYTSTGRHAPLPADYELTLHRWYNMGVPMRLITMAIARAMTITTKGGDFPEFAYMCGIIWNKINEHDIDYSVTEETAAVYTEFEASEKEVYAYDIGRNAGRDFAQQHSRAMDFLGHHIDGTTTGLIDRFTYEAA